jgi:regulator of cell morphogenesis and NO signaling
MIATPAPTIGDLVAGWPELADLFDSLGIDFCCGGQRSLEDACREAGLDFPTVFERVLAIQADRLDGPATVPSLADLCEQIVATHHAYLRRQLPLIDRLLDRVVTAHLARHPELARLKRVFEEFAFDIGRHMAKEEQVLFPAIARLEQDGRLPAGPFGSVRDPIAVMEHDHDRAGDELGMMRELTAGFVPPADACPTYRALLAALIDLERDMHRHVHAENNVLFPAAQRLEADLEERFGHPAGRLELPRV